MEHLFSFFTEDRDRNAISLVCREWYDIERLSRRSLCIVNCDDTSLSVAIRRFPSIRSVYVKYKRGDFNANSRFSNQLAEPWVATMADRWPDLEKLCLKRMIVNDDCLDLIARSFKKLRLLSLSNCRGVTTIGLSSIAANCRNLMELDLPDTEITDTDRWDMSWLSDFPHDFTSLMWLDVSYVSNALNSKFIHDLEHLVNRCPNIQSLWLGVMPLKSIINILQSARQLADLGFYWLSTPFDSTLFNEFNTAFANSEGIRRLNLSSNFLIIHYLSVIASICKRLTALQINDYLILRSDVMKLLSKCSNLRQLWVRDYIGDDGLNVVAASCKLLEEIRVFPKDDKCVEVYSLTENGLVAISKECSSLKYIYYSCHDKMTNAALVAVARNCPNLVCFRLSMPTHSTADYVTEKPLDAGFSAIVESCKDLKRLSLTGSLTDDVFRAIGASAKRLEVLSVISNGGSDFGLHCILSGCKNLRKLDIQSCPFGDNALLVNAEKLKKIQSIRMSGCSVTLGACKFLTRVMPWIKVDIMHAEMQETLASLPNNFIANRISVYTTIASPESDIL